MSDHLRRAAVSFALAAMMLRALLPTGWMPNPDGFTGAPLIICSTDMSQSMRADISTPPGKSAPGDIPSKQNQSDDHQTCPFSAAPHIAAPLIAALLSPPSILGNSHDKALLSAAPLPAALYQPQSPRAPPATA